MRTPEFWTRDDLSSRLLAGALSPIGWVYGASVTARKRFTKPLRTRARVVCIGNLTAGGTGKTPIAIAIAEILIAQGRRVVFLSRGYGGRERGPILVDAARHSADEVGDEPLLLSRIAPVIVSRDRRDGAKVALDNGADVIVMDDGHQNFQLAKELSIVVLDAGSPFGNGRILPAGPLREAPAQGLARADAVILVGPAGASLRTRLPVLRARVEPAKPQQLADQRVFAFAGIGQPERFFDTLAALGAVIVGKRAFADHHPYTTSEIDILKVEARGAGARLVTTEKDFVRLSDENRRDIETLPVRAQFEDERALEQLLSRL
jgi:tetraacyldisaccharide 4'-kinase